MRTMWILVVVALAGACATSSGMREVLLKRAVFDLDCDRAKLEALQLTSTLGGYQRTFGVSGCDKRATYIVTGDGVNGYSVLLNSPAPRD